MQIDPHEVAIELRAQIDMAFSAGLRPTHLDSHQCLLQIRGRELFEVFIGLGREYDLPILVSREWFTKFSYLEPLLGPSDIVLDRVTTIDPPIPPEQWFAWYRQALEELPAGVSEILLHPALDDDELRAFFGDRIDWGAAWRQRDLDIVTSTTFENLLNKEGIKLIAWREIVSRLRSSRDLLRPLQECSTSATTQKMP
jgi:hypothetical protein